MSVIDLFDLNHPEWSFDSIHAELGVSRSTLYRYLKTLIDSGILTSLPGRGYTLGPRVIELNHQILLTDPLIHVAQPIMKEIVSGLSCISLLCRRYKEKVLCVHQESSTSQFSSQFERGKAMPLLLGAASLAILAHFQPYQLGKLYNHHAAEFDKTGLGGNLPAVRQTLKRMRQAGWIFTEGHVNRGVTGVAAPIFDSAGEIIASLSVTLQETAIEKQRLDSIGERILFCARIITKSIS